MVAASGDVNDKGRPLSGNSDEDAPIVDKLLGKIRQGNFTDSPDFQVTKVAPVRLDGEMPAIANGTANDSATDASSRPSTPSSRVDISRSNSLRHSGSRRYGKNRMNAIEEDRASSGKARSEDLSVDLDTEEMYNFLLTETERLPRRRNSKRGRTALSTSLTLDRDRAPSPALTPPVDATTSEQDAKTDTTASTRPRSPRHSRTSPTNTPESPLAAKDAKPRYNRSTSHDAIDASRSTSLLDSTRRRSHAPGIAAVDRDVSDAPLPAKSTDDRVSRLLEQARLKSLEKIQKGEIAVSPVISETDIKSMAVRPEVGANLVNGDAYDVSEHNNNDLLYGDKTTSGRLRTDVDRTIKEVETYGRDMLDNWDSMIDKKHEQLEVKPVVVVPEKQRIRERYLKYLPGAKLDDDAAKSSSSSSHRPVSTYDNVSSQPGSRYERLKARLKQRDAAEARDDDDDDTATTSRFSRSKTLPHRLRGGYDVRRKSIEEEQPNVPRSERYRRTSRLTGNPMLPSSVELGHVETAQLEESVRGHHLPGTAAPRDDAHYSWLSDEDRTRRGSRLQSIKDRYSAESEADTSFCAAPTASYSALRGGAGEYTSALGATGDDAAVSPRSAAVVAARNDKEDSHSEASSKDEGFESASQRTSMSSNLEQELHREQEAAAADLNASESARGVDSSVDISRSVDSLVKNPNFALTETVNIDDLPSHHVVVGGGGDKSAEAWSTCSSDYNRTITNTPDSELNDDSVSSKASAPPTPSRTSSKYASDKAVLPPTPKTAKSSKSPGRTGGSVFSRLTQSSSDKKSRSSDVKDTKSRASTADTRKSTRTPPPRLTPGAARPGSSLSGGDSHSGSSTPTSRRKTATPTARDAASATTPHKTSPLSATTNSTVTGKPRKPVGGAPIGAARTSLSSTPLSHDSAPRRPTKPGIGAAGGVRSPLSAAGGSRSGSRSSSRQGSTEDVTAPPAKHAFVRGGYGRQTMPASMRFNRNKAATTERGLPTPPERTTSIRASERNGGARHSASPTAKATTPVTARRNANRNSKVAPISSTSPDVAAVHTSSSVAGDDKKKRTSSSGGGGGGNVFARLVANTPGRRLNITKSMESSSPAAASGDKKAKVKSATTKASRC